MFQSEILELLDTLNVKESGDFYRLPATGWATTVFHPSPANYRRKNIYMLKFIAAGMVLMV